MNQAAKSRSPMKGEFLVLASTPNDAKHIENQLRSSAHPVRMIVAPGLDSFVDILNKSDIELVIFDESMRGTGLLEVVEAVSRNKPSTPIITLCESADPQQSTDASEKGARGVISMSNMNHLIMVLQREYDFHQLQRDNAALRIKLAEAESTHAALLGSSDEPVIQVQEGIVVSANPALATMLGLEDADQLAGMPLMDLIAGTDQARVKDRVKLCLKGKDPGDPLEFALSFEDRVATLEARLIRTEIEGDPAIEIAGLPKPGAPSRTAAPPSAISRRALYEALDAVTSNGAGIDALVFIRVDDFRHLEERVGYIGAEELVLSLRHLLGEVTAESDGVFQFSMSELVVLGRRNDIDDVTKSIRRFQRGVARHIFTADEKEVSITTSAVVYPLPHDKEDPEETLRLVRSAVSELEKSGGGGIKVTGSRIEDIERKKAADQWVVRIKQALADNRFDLAFQNIASLTGDERQTSDVLLRMIGEDGNEILARDFIPIAEEQGLMPALDRWVLTTAISRLSALAKERKEACFFVRVSEATLSDAGSLLNLIKEQQAAHPTGKCELVLTLRERMLQDHLKKAQALAKKAKEMGLGIAIDHFGITRHSPQLLARLPIDYIKLHSDFTETIGKSGADLKPLESIMESARQHKIRTIAERITDANSMARLWQLGVNYIMGSHVHEPETALTDTRFSLR